jgi:hypothetical protein
VENVDTVRITTTTMDARAKVDTLLCTKKDVIVNINKMSRTIDNFDHTNIDFCVLLIR